MNDSGDHLPVRSGLSDDVSEPRLSFERWFFGFTVTLVGGLVVLNLIQPAVRSLVHGRPANAQTAPANVDVKPDDARWAKNVYALRQARESIEKAQRAVAASTDDASRREALAKLDDAKRAVQGIIDSVTSEE